MSDPECDVCREIVRERNAEIERLRAERDELQKKANILDGMWVHAEQECAINAGLLTALRKRLRTEREEP